MRNIVILAALALPLGGCVTDETFSNQNIGTVVGAGAGVLAGSMFGQGNGRIIAMALGGAAGAWAGNQIGAKLDENARLKRQGAAEAALNRPANAPPVTWSSDLPPEPVAASQSNAAPAPKQTAAAPAHRRATGSAKTVGESSDAGRPCRTIEEDVDIAGEKEKVRSTFCKVNGDWIPKTA